MILFLASKNDIAATNIANRILAKQNFEKISEWFFGNQVYSNKMKNNGNARLTYIDEDSTNTQTLSFPQDTTLLVFLSRHSSKSGTPTLSVHAPGNLGNATLGGLPRKVSISSANAMRKALMEMKSAQEESAIKYEVSYECTHHGPSLDVPTMFVELGSTPTEWQDTEAAEAVARAAIATMSSKKSVPAVLGIGGPHYNKKFTELALNTEVAFGHIIPKYAINIVDKEILWQCITRTLEPVKRAILDWKGIIGSDKEGILNLLYETGVEIEKI